MNTLGFLKQTGFFRLIYKLKFLVRTYHFLWAFFSALIYFFPSRKILVIGVTGTKGKTTVMEILKSILDKAQEKTAFLSSLYVKIGNDQEKNLTENTMPGRMFIQRFLNRAVNSGCRYAVIEVTSEGVVLSRHRFIRWQAGLLTNLAPEHIEAHGSFEKYRQAKLNFFKKVFKQGGKLFFNQDDQSADFFKNQFNREKINFYSKRDLKKYFLTIDNNLYLFSSNFNQENLSAAISLAKLVGVKDEVIKEAVLEFKGVAGRMEIIKEKPFKVVIDYAHTPESLRRVYDNLQNANGKEQRGRLICVLGAAGGGRDKWKRPVMGKIAAEFCDEIILTNEDPYNEKPQNILDELKEGVLQIANSKSREVLEILDRKEAIRKAIGLAKEGDMVVITGKGSEEFIHIENGKKLPWSERGAVGEVLKMIE